jgi:hypothetical protein
MVTRNIVRLASQSAGFITNASASTTYLTQTSASNTYLTQLSASTTYLTKSSGSTTYLTQSSASSTYAALSGAAFTGNVSTTGKVTDSLPAPVIDYSTSGSSDNVMAVTAVTFSDVTTTASGTVQVSITCPSAIYAIVSYSAWLTAGPNTSVESLRVSTTATGATTWSSGGAKGWGNALWTTGIAANGSGQSASSDFTTLLNAGTTTITMQAYRTATALTTANISFPYLSVTPISWA